MASKSKLTKQKLIAIIVAIVLAIIIIPSGIYCIVNHESPAQLVGDIFSSKEEQIIGKWQGEKAATAYEFYEDGTYDSYISTFSYTGRYSIDGNEITLNNLNASGTVTYKFSVHGKTLTMQILKENGIDVADNEKISYSKVNRIKTTSLADLIEELTTEETK